MFEWAPISKNIQVLLDKRRKSNLAGGHSVVLDSERTRIYTDYYKAHEAEHPILKRAHCLYEWAKNRAIWIDDDDIFVGSLGRSYRSLHMYVEWNVSWLDELVNDSDESFETLWKSGDGQMRIPDADRANFKEAARYWKSRCFPARMADLIPEPMYGIKGDGITDYLSRTDVLSDMPMGHFSTNYNKAVRVGFGAIRREASAKMAAMEGRVFGDNARRYTFYRAVTIVCDAAILLAKRYAALAAEKAERAEGDLKKKFLKMADSLNWIMEHPARSTWEALEVVLLYQHMLITDAQQHGLTLGRLDQVAGDFMEDELKAGTMTKEEAQELSDAFILKLQDNLALSRMPTKDNVLSQMKSNNGGGFNYTTNGQHYTVGGVKKDGTDATNALTLCLLQTAGRLYLADPSISCRIHQGTPDEVWTLAIESSKRSGGIPTLENDDVIIPGLMKRGISREDANDYTIIGCVEPVVGGAEWPACGCTGKESFFNLLGCIVLAINNGKNPKTGYQCPVQNGFLYEMEQFEQFKEAFADYVRYGLNWCVTGMNVYELMYSENFCSVVASATMDGCMESGLDVSWGGAKYNSTGITACGIGNVADALYAVKHYCFDTKRWTLRELYDALNANFEGYEELYSVLNNEMAHYGNNVEEVDELAAWAMSVFADHLNNDVQGVRGNWRGGTFTMTVHLDYGMRTMATPDGRRDGDPMADAISPRQGYDVSGPTAYLTSASKLPHIDLMNGDQLNIRFSPSVVAGEEGNTKLRCLIETYFDMGGMQVQFNVVGAVTLYAAQLDPAAYKNLIVRIAGFSAYFVEMPRVMQDDFISRTEQSEC